MSLVGLVGWIALHALWQGTLVAGIVGLTLGLLPHARPAARGRVASIGLALVVIAPVVTALLKMDVLSDAARRPVMMAVDRAIAMPTYLAWRSAAIPVIGALWLAGVAVGLIRLYVAGQRAAALRADTTGQADDHIRMEVTALSNRLGVVAPVEARRSALAEVPMVIGWQRPVILLPDRAIADLSFEQLRSILAHELAHVGRGDYLANVWQLIAERLTFFHPASRWLSRVIRVEREYSCDDTAIRVAGNRAIYARALAALDDRRSDCPLAVAAVSGTLLDRIERIAGRPRRPFGAGRGAAILLALTVTAAALLAITLALPQDLPPGTRVRSSHPPAGFAGPPTGGVEQPKPQTR